MSNPPPLAGRCYENGLGVTKDLSEAAVWYRRAADQNNTAGKINLSRRGPYSRPRRAADQNNTAGKINLSR
eukprot:340761-Prorocentrum_minimum.AAC.1